MAVRSLGMTATRLLLVRLLLLGTLLATLFVAVHVLTIEVLQHFVVIVLRTRVHLARQNLGKLCQSISIHLSPFWHLDLEFNDKVTIAAWVLKEG